ncbi:hypothetical protein NA57DRAFT_81773 [Rhizodiscina lignyota]|uniref:Uncharacterized protein n=1 Tax=Rhizodiscina lignyota TaxID=1504668 RepID=A0A9P4I623_9PEZI|nr:hypothetical protein NA57DRAFT_81773 [Rhizodiscina lignyota]
MEHSWQYTLCSWAVFSAVGYGAYRYYTHTTRPGQSSNRATREQQDVKQRNRRKEGQSDLSGSERQKILAKEKAQRAKRSRASKQEQPSNRFEALRDEGADQEPEVEENDKEWAAQLDNLRKGTNLEAPKRKEARAKTVKQASAGRTPELSATSSTTGGDADDDLSPALSPALGATTVKSANAPSAKDVSDMLEPTASAPTVLRVTPAGVKPKGTAEQGWELAGKKDKPKSQESAAKAEAETKKQRQNKRKAEEQKAQREADEQARRVLMEQQRRTAREARGEPAKNGLVSPVTVNSWSSGRSESTIVPAAPAAGSTNGPMLDTFDHDGASTASSSNVANNTSSPISNTTSSQSYWDHLPSEEEQMRQLAEQDESNWSTVTDKKKQRKKKTQEAPANGEVKDVVAGGKRLDSPIATGNNSEFDFEKYRQQEDSDWAVA